MWKSLKRIIKITLAGTLLFCNTSYATEPKAYDLASNQYSIAKEMSTKEESSTKETSWAQDHTNLFKEHHPRRASLESLIYHDAETFVDLGDNLERALPIYAWGLAKADKDPDSIPQFYKHTISSTLVKQILKVTLDRPRPNDEVRDEHRRELGLPVDKYSGGHHSKPSGHTQAAFSAAWYIAFRHGFREAMVPLAYATACGLSRLDKKERWSELPENHLMDYAWKYKNAAHHWDDVLLGAAIPFVTAAIFVSPADDIPYEPVRCIDLKGMSIEPYVEGSNAGFKFRPWDDDNRYLYLVVKGDLYAGFRKHF